MKINLLPNIKSRPSNGIPTFAEESASPARLREAHTFAIIEAVTRKTISEFDQRLVETWFQSLFSRNLGFTVLEHAALLVMRQVRYHETYLSSDSKTLFELTLEISWDQLTRATHAPMWPVGAELHAAKFPYLPASVLSQTTEEARVVYDTVFHSGAREQLLFDPLPKVTSSWFEIKTRIVSSVFFNRQTLVMAVVLIPLLFVPVVREIVLGLIIGMMGASVNEYMVHLGVGHSSPELAKSFRKFGYFGLFAEEINLAHRVHHSKMMGDFRSDFTNEKVRERVDIYLSTEADKLISSRVRDGQCKLEKKESETQRVISEIKAGGYGVDGTAAGCIAMNVIAAPFFTLNYLLSLTMTPGLERIVFMIASCVFLSSFIMQSMYSHRYLHYTKEDLENPEYLHKTTAFMRWFMTTSLGQLQTRRHYRHHHEKYDYQRTVNGVIMSFSFADFIFRRGVHEAELNHLLKMRKEGFLNYSK